MLFMWIFTFCLTAALSLAATLTTGATQYTLRIVCVCVAGAAFIAAMAALVSAVISTWAGDRTQEPA